MCIPRYITKHWFLDRTGLSQDSIKNKIADTNDNRVPSSTKLFSSFHSGWIYELDEPGLAYAGRPNKKKKKIIIQIKIEKSNLLWNRILHSIWDWESEKEKHVHLYVSTVSVILIFFCNLLKH